MLAEIFMVRLEAATRLLKDGLPLSGSPFVSFAPDKQFTFKDGRKLPSGGVDKHDTSRMNQNDAIKEVPSMPDSTES
jgi:hypothetical protein